MIYIDIEVSVSMIYFGTKESDIIICYDSDEIY